MVRCLFLRKFVCYPRFIQLLGHLLRCAHKRIVNNESVNWKEMHATWINIIFRKKYRIYSRLLFRTDEVNETRMFTLG